MAAWSKAAEEADQLPHGVKKLFQDFNEQIEPIMRSVQRKLERRKQLESSQPAVDSGVPTRAPVASETTTLETSTEGNETDDNHQVASDTQPQEETPPGNTATMI